jgi:hypothetical protein
VWPIGGTKRVIVSPPDEAPILTKAEGEPPETGEAPET